MWACVIAADAAIPDNPNGPNQSQTAEKANLSDAKCDSVLLDRKAPSVSIAGAASAKVGELVSFGAQASDATSGVVGAFEWSFGDNTGAGPGESVNHTFTRPGPTKCRQDDRWGRQPGHRDEGRHRLGAAAAGGAATAAARRRRQPAAAPTAAPTALVDRRLSTAATNEGDHRRRPPAPRADHRVRGPAPRKVKLAPRRSGSR